MHPAAALCEDLACCTVLAQARPHDVTSHRTSKPALGLHVLLGILLVLVVAACDEQSALYCSLPTELEIHC